MNIFEKFVVRSFLLGMIIIIDAVYDKSYDLGSVIVVLIGLYFIVDPAIILFRRRVKTLN